MPKVPHYSQEAAEMLAIQALGFLAEDPDRLAGFASATGVEVHTMREASRQPDFLAGVLEHLLADENLLVAFADNAGIDPLGVARARQALGKVWERDLP
jgi:N6-adenosine-specific RNA methylase IME4